MKGLAVVNIYQTYGRLNRDHKDKDSTVEVERSDSSALKVFATTVKTLAFRGLRKEECNFHSIAGLQHYLSLERRVAAVHLVHIALDPLEPLEQPRQHIAHLRERELLPDADPWTAIEGNFIFTHRSALIVSKAEN